MLILGAGVARRQSDVHGRGVPERMRKKTNLAMMVSALESQGIASGPLGRYRVDENRRRRIFARDQSRGGIFGVAPGTGMKTNQNVMGALRKNTLFTNVAMTSDREPWWEGIGSEPPTGLINWKGRGVDPSKGAAAHPNARYTVPAKQSPSISPKWRRRKAFRFQRLYLADDGPEWRHWCMNLLTGNTACS